MTTHTNQQPEAHPEWSAAVYLLRAPILNRRTAAFIDDDRREIDWDALEASRPRWSAGQELLVRAARDLWHGGGNVNLHELCCVLDSANYQRFVDALQLRRGHAATDMPPLARDEES